MISTETPFVEEIFFMLFLASFYSEKHDLLGNDHHEVVKKLEHCKVVREKVRAYYGVAGQQQ